MPKSNLYFNNADDADELDKEDKETGGDGLEEEEGDIFGDEKGYKDEEKDEEERYFEGGGEAYKEFYEDNFDEEN